MPTLFNIARSTFKDVKTFTGCRIVYSSQKAGFWFEHHGNQVTIHAYYEGFWRPVRAITLAEAISLEALVTDALNTIGTGTTTHFYENQVRETFPHREVSWCGLGSSGFHLRKPPAKVDTQLGIQFVYNNVPDLRIALYLWYAHSWNMVVPALRYDELVTTRCMLQDVMHYLRENAEGG